MAFVVCLLLRSPAATEPDNILDNVNICCAQDRNLLPFSFDKGCRGCHMHACSVYHPGMPYMARTDICRTIKPEREPGSVSRYPWSFHGTYRPAYTRGRLIMRPGPTGEVRSTRQYCDFSTALGHLPSSIARACLKCTNWEGLYMPMLRACLGQKVGECCTAAIDREGLSFTLAAAAYQAVDSLCCITCLLWVEGFQRFGEARECGLPCWSPYRRLRSRQADVSSSYLTWQEAWPASSTRRKVHQGPASSSGSIAPYQEVFHLTREHGIMAG